MEAKEPSDTSILYDVNCYLGSYQTRKDSGVVVAASARLSGHYETEVDDLRTDP